MTNLLKTTLFVFFSASLAPATTPRQRIQGNCEQGNQAVITPGSQSSTTKVQRSYPSCTVTVYHSVNPSAGIVTLTRLANVVTVVTKTRTNFLNGSTVIISGTSDATYHATTTITSILSETSFTYTKAGADGSATGGTAALSGLTLAPIYADDAGTVKANPFTAATNGIWFFYADDGRYDVKLSGSGISTPFTLGDRPVFDSRSLVVGSGAVNRNLKDKANDAVSIRDFGAIADNIADDSAALASCVAVSSVCRIPGPATYLINTDTTIPSTATLIFDGGVFNVGAAKTLTINGPVIAGESQLFSGSGAVTLSGVAKQVLPQWWGAKGDGTTDDSAAFAACATASTVCRIAGPGTYLINTNTTIPSTVTLIFDGGILSIGAGKTLTINGPIQASERQQIFAGTGTVLGLNNKVSVLWWGTNAAAFASAYAALPSTGGTIRAPRGSYTLDAAVSFSTNNKPILLECEPGSATTLTYTPINGTALTFNYGTGHRMGHGMQGCTITGPGNATTAIGVMVGGTQGAEGFSWTDNKVQTFGYGVWFNSHTWITRFRGGMIRDCTMLLITASGRTEAGENLYFTDVTFADAPTPHTSAVWIQGEGDTVTFQSCSFDQAQLRIGNGATSAAQVTVVGSHFENPNYAWVGAAHYDFITVDNHNGNVLRLLGGHFLQDDTVTGQAQYITLNGGAAYLFGVSVYTQPGIGPAMTHFATLANAVNVMLFGFDDLSANISGTFWGGSTTGSVMSFPGADPTLTAHNFVIGSADGGGTYFDVAGNIRTRAQLQSIVATGTAPLQVNSTTPVNNLFGNVLTYTAAGNQNTATTWITYGRVALAGGTATVNFTKSYTSNSSYRCALTNEGASNAASVVLNTGAQMTITGTGTDDIAYICVGY